jgi:uncharacterized protein (UPF0332 family)
LLAKAERAASSARALLDLGDSDGACSRAYYAMFDAARAALATRGHAPEGTKTHGAVHSAFALEFVKTGQIPREIGRALGQVQDIRLLADYAAEPVPLEKAEWSVGQAAAFVAAVRDLLS